MKKNNTAEKAALNAEKITKALQESTEKSLRDIINEAISNVIAEDDDELEEPKDDSYDVQDVEPDETPEVSDVDDSGEEGGEEVADDAPESEEGEDGAEGEDDEWSDMEQYKIGDDDYDFTGVDGDEILKVYNKLGDDDQIFVKKEDDGTYSVKDDETGAEFVIELNPEAMDDAESEGGEEGDVFDVELGDDDDEMSDDFGGEEGGDEFDFGSEEGEEEPELGGDDEIEIDLGDEEADDEDELNEDNNLGYTDSYQKDVFDKKFNMNEPADGKTTYSMDAGAPKGAEKPWAGKGNPKPFGASKDTVDEEVDECGGANCDPNAQVPAYLDANLEENGGTIASTDARHMKKGQLGQHRPNAPAYDVRKVDSPLSENVKKIIAKAKAIQAENKQYKDNLDRIKKSLYEAAVLNVNLGRLVDILVNETTTKDEKKSILERFNNVKTISEGKSLWATIKTELNETKKSAPLMEKQFAANSTSLNETTIYTNSNNPSLDLMNRMDDLYKK
ncbi:MAG: hypothetical protein J6X18_13740 [Bacteroidales bacterium]|nr:hypothetical protein [Bacteroidales bacterium]